MSIPPEVAAARLVAIRAALEQALQPLHLELRDDSHRHVGHAGARDGRGHYSLHIASEAFAGQTPLQRHRTVYAALGSLMETDIHALSIDAEWPLRA